MDKNTFIKISAALFVFLSLIISLFLPFEFGNEKLRTLQERNANSKIIDTLPIKQYDFIFHNNKKYFVLDSTVFQKLLAKESLEFYKEKWKDKEFKFIRSIDSFFTAKGFLFSPFSEERDSNGKRMITKNINYKDYGLVYHRYNLNEMPKNYKISYEEVPSDKEKFIIQASLDASYPLLEDSDYVWQDIIALHYNENRSFKDWVREQSQNTINMIGIKSYSVNYKDVESEYERDPFSWNWGMFFQLDSTGNYEEYEVTQPVYYLLDRNILFSELVVEYILALFVSLVTGYITEKIIPMLKKS
jgi:hypothetical protein